MSDLLFTVENHIARITMNRPNQMNAFSTEMMDLWIKALETVRDSDDIRVVVLTGNGKAFCAGGDIKAMSQGELLYKNNPDEDLSSTALARKNSLWKRIQRIPQLMRELDQPVIAAINGAAIGAGLDMALACDIRIAAQSAKLGEGYVNVGIVPGDGGAYLLPRVVGVDKALEMLWLGDAMTADEAKNIGLVTHVVPDDEFSAFVENYVQRLAKGPQTAMRFMKRAVYQGLYTDFRTHLDYISSAMGIVTELEDYKEGVRAILERRKPKFQ